MYVFRGTEQRTGSGEEKRDLGFRLGSRGLESRFYFFFIYHLIIFPVIGESCYNSNSDLAQCEDLPLKYLVILSCRESSAESRRRVPLTCDTLLQPHSYTLPSLTYFVCRMNSTQSIILYNIHVDSYLSKIKPFSLVECLWFR